MALGFRVWSCLAVDGHGGALHVIVVCVLLCGVWGVGVGVWGVVVKGLGVEVWGLGSGGLALGVWGLELGVWC